MKLSGVVSEAASYDEGKYHIIRVDIAKSEGVKEGEVRFTYDGEQQFSVGQTVSVTVA